MLSLLKADVYKIFKRMSFYICWLLCLLATGYSAWTFEQTLKNAYKEQFGMYASLYGLDFDSMTAKDLGITAWSVINQSLPNVILIAVVFMTIFVASEFSSGMCKNVILRGKSRISYYLSKMISLMVVPIVYTLSSCGINFAIGAYRWQGVEWKNEYLEEYIIPIGWFVLVALAWVSIICMICFLCRSSGFSMAINVGLATSLIPGAIVMLIQYVSKNWFNFSSVKYMDYWIGNYSTICLSGQNVSGDALMTLIYTIAGWFLVPAIIGILVFQHREIK